MNNEIQISLYDLTKTERGEFVTRLVDKLDAGEANPLQVHKQVKSMEDLIKQITANEDYRKHLLDEAGKYGKSFELNGAKYQVKEAGTKYDYSQCNDPFYDELQAAAILAAEKLKARAIFLQSLPTSGMIITDPLTGETYTAYPPSKSSTTTVSITLS
jgi:hypothetical protein